MTYGKNRSPAKPLSSCYRRNWRCRSSRAASTARRARSGPSASPWPNTARPCRCRAARKSAKSKPMRLGGAVTSSVIARIAAAISSWAGSVFLPFLLKPVPCSDRKARSSSRPCTCRRSERPETVKTRRLARDRLFFCPFSQKNTGPTFDRRGRGDILAARRGAALLKQKLQPAGLSEFFFSQIS